jgi:hypothetical protein
VHGDGSCGDTLGFSILVVGQLSFRFIIAVVFVFVIIIIITTGWRDHVQTEQARNDSLEQI